MDKIDYLILSELLKDASLLFVEIAEKVGTTPYTVRRRYEKMKKEGVIHRCIVSIDLSKLGYQGKAFLLITLTPNGNKSETISYLKTIKNIIVVTEIIGSYDILAIAPITDLKSIQTIVKEARKAPYLQRVELACIDDINFPVSPNFGTILSQKSQALANI
ncbi:winged helix-turn-helix transcriptional regulator [Candidatus Bathyarchaeota archaeon]|nr:winged helix-turn-helix transcriptional regulator [Candidatus Bathyarchaeota archaeon]